MTKVTPLPRASVSLGRRIAATAVTVCIVTLAAYALFQWIRFYPVREKLAATERQHAELKAGLMKAYKLGSIEPQPRHNSSIPPANAPGVVAADLSISAKQRREIQLIRARPELQPKYFEAETAALGTLYGPLLRALKLSSEQSSQVLAALARRAQRTVDIQADALQRQQALSDPIITSEIQEQNTNTEVGLQRILGPEAFGHLQSYEATVNIRSVVGALASNLYFDHPLNADQSARLITALATAVPAGPVLDPVLADRGPPGTDWDAAVEQVTNILGPEQLNTFRLIAKLNKEGWMH